ncbi:MAG: TlpA family protein disulfide reductase [Rickettsiales bacterium]|jgi:thiol-disulfide isomerase/thioredoxin|nr:TlpA family protein disulfide reductase [Rickettsiales bacterium]
MIPSDSPSLSPQKPRDKWFFAFFILAIIGVSIYAANHSPSGIKVPGVYQMEPQALMPTEFQDEAGNILTTADLTGQVTILHFWATWCAPCIEELPELNEFKKSEIGQAVRIVPISVDATSSSHVRAFYKSHGIDALDLYADPQQSAFHSLASVPALPTTIILNAQGQQVASIRGAFNWKRDEMKALLHHYITGETPIDK